MRQTNSSFGLTKLGLHVLGEEKGEKRRRREGEKFRYGFVWNHVSFGFLGFLVWISMGISCSILGFSWDIILTLDLLKLYG